MYYNHYNRNVGRIKSMEGNNLIANINPGHGGGEINIAVDRCFGFTPQVNDRVLLCIDENGLLLRKLKKTRQDRKLNK